MSYRKNIESFLANHPYSHMKINGADFKYIAGGDEKNPAIVFLNGGMNTMEMWHEYMDKLTPNYRVVMFDYPMEITENSKMADAVAAFLSVLGIKKAYFAGASYGGIMAQVITREHPEIVSGLGLFSTAGLDENVIKKSKRKYALLPLLIWYMKHCNYEKLKPKLIKSSEKYMRQETEENKKYLTEMFQLIFKNYTVQKDIHITSLMGQVMSEKPCTKKNFEGLKGHILAVFPEKDYFTENEQKALIDLMGNPVIKHIKNGHYGTVLESDNYVKWMKEVFA